MPIFDYQCKKCEFKDEFIKSVSVPKELQPPEICPKCGGEMVQLFTLNKTLEFDLRGTGFYETEYGKKAWKRNLTTAQQADVLLGNRDPW